MSEIVRFEGQTALVTGAAQGIGAAIARRLHDERANIICLDVQGPNDPQIEALVDSQRCSFERCDVTDAAGVAAAVHAAVARFGGIDAVVNNAGVNAYYDAVEMTEREWDSFMALDLKAAWLVAREAIPHLRARGGGSITNIASIHATLTTDGMFPYAAAKAGLVGLTRSLALDLGPDGIRVNAVCPGYTRTALVDEWFARQAPGVEQRVLAAHPLGRIGTPADIAGLVAYLISDDAAFVTGAALAIDGGLSARFAP